MKKGILSITLLSFTLFSISGCGAQPLGNRNVGQHNTKDVIYTKHGKISGKALTGPDSVSDLTSQHPFSWSQSLGSLHHVYNSPTNYVEQPKNSPDTLPKEPNDQTNPTKYNVAPTPNKQSDGDITNVPNTNTKSSSAQKNIPKTNTTINQMDALAKQVIQIVNKTRQDKGLPALKTDPELVKMANLKAQDMLAHDYFSHTSPTYGSPFDMMNKLGITYQSAGENIAEGQSSATKVMTDWMNSPGHRANILSKDYTYIGVGHTTNKGIWVQEFIKK